MNLKETLEKCKELDFNEEITRETLWNTAYDLGRSRWYWGPRWFVSLHGWINAEVSHTAGRKPETEGMK